MKSQKHLCLHTMMTFRHLVTLNFTLVPYNYICALWATWITYFLYLSARHVLTEHIKKTTTMHTRGDIVLIREGFREKYMEN